jgi:hypothetical protein
MAMSFCGIGSMSAEAVTATTCTAGSQSVSDPAHCSVGGGDTFANATVTINNLTSVPSKGSFTESILDLSESAAAQNTDTSASATTNISYQFLTQGPVRQGQLQVIGFGDWDVAPGYNNSGIASASLGSLTGSCSSSFGPARCSGLLNYPTGNSSVIPFTLGTSFVLNFSEIFAASAVFNENSSLSGRTVLDFKLFEADGKTPVAISATPEPSSFSLLLLASPAAWLYRRKRRM